MAQTAFQVQYRQEYIAGFEQKKSLLRQSVTTEAVIKGNQATFLVADSGGATAVTRGVNGKIPGRSDNLNQYTATLVEWHDLPQRTKFNVFASQGDGRRIMQETSIGVLNRRIDVDIINELGNATHTTNLAATALTFDLVLRAQTMLQVAQVPWDGNITFLVSPAALGYLLRMPEFSKSTLVDATPIKNNPAAWSDTPKMYNWLNMNIIVCPLIPGIATNAEKLFMYHRSAIGHAADTEGMTALAGYNEEQDYYWARASMYMGPKLLQNSGVVVINHDGSGMAGAS